MHPAPSARAGQLGQRLQPEPHAPHLGHACGPNHTISTPECSTAKHASAASCPLFFWSSGRRTLKCRTSSWRSSVNTRPARPAQQAQDRAAGTLFGRKRAHGQGLAGMNHARCKFSELQLAPQPAWLSRLACPPTCACRAACAVHIRLHVHGRIIVDHVLQGGQAAQQVRSSVAQAVLGMRVSCAARRPRGCPAWG